MTRPYAGARQEVIIRAAERPSPVRVTRCAVRATAKTGFRGDALAGRRWL